jgi:hypothetical protein
MKCLRSENGGEYVNRPFEEYLVLFGIDWQRSVPHTPQQNGVAEHKKRMLVEMARCLLHAKDMPLRFWVEGVYCASSNYLLNHILTRAVLSMILGERWCGKKPSTTHLRVF